MIDDDRPFSPPSRFAELKGGLVTFLIEAGVVVVAILVAVAISAAVLLVV